MSQSTGLLGVLQCETGCMYLSDLHTSSNIPAILHVLRKIDPAAYSLWEWTDAVCYITGKNIRFERISDAVRYLKEYSPEKAECPNSCQK